MRIMVSTVALGIALAWALPVAAQSQAPAPSGPSAAENEAPSSSDIIVTARRRSERLQDVPVAITQISGDNLTQKGIRNGADLVNAVPTLTVAPISGRRDVLAFELRGISVSEALIPQDPGVAIYVNDVVAARPYGVQGALYDLESVQVLFGPQGTLFGRNSTAGAILLNSKKPVLGTFGGEARVTLGDYARKDFLGILNVPLGETLAIRVAANRKSIRGFTKEQVTGLWLDNEDVTSARVSLLWQPSSAFRSITVADIYDSSNNNSGNVISAARPFGTVDPEILRLTGLTRATGVFAGVFGAANPAGVIAAQVARGPREVNFGGVVPYSRQKIWSVSNTTSFDIADNLTLKNIVGYRNVSTSDLTDTDGSQLPGLTVAGVVSTDQFSNETQLSGVSFGKQLNWIVGGYFFQESGFDRSTVNAFNPSPAASTQTEAGATNISRSVFGQGTFRPSGLEQFSLTVGARYTWDKRVLDARSRTAGGGCGVYNDDASTQPLPVNNCSKVVSANFAKPSYNITADYKITPDVLVYLAHRLGYRSGGFNPRGITPSGLIPFDPETISDFELGVKSSFHSGGFSGRFNLAAYVAKYKNIQRSKAILVGGLPTTTIVNAASATIKGGEAELMLSPVRGLEFTFTGSIADFNIDTINTSVQTQTNPFGPSTVVPVTVNNIPGSNSKYSWGFNAQYNTAIGDGFGDLSLAFNYKWRSSQRSPLSLPFYEAESFIPAYGLASANIRLANIAGSQFYGAVFVDNLFDKTTPISSLSIQQTFGVTFQTYSAPRMFGIEAGVKF